MTFSQITTATALALVFILPMNTAIAANKSVFKNKTSVQHELTAREKNKIDAEFKAKFQSSKTASRSKVGGNPWAAKKAKKEANKQKVLELSNSWGYCREFSYKQRGQCYARGGDAYTCERYYDARVEHCDKAF